MNDLLSAAELDQMRADLETLLPDTCIIASVSYVSNGAGEWVPTWTDAGSVACRLDPIRGSEKISGGAIEAFNGYILTLPYNAVIVPTNRVTVNGTDYNVTSVTIGDSWKLDTRCQIERL
jgi:SPP1 family predicted phage head-tail adaptor